MDRGELRPCPWCGGRGMLHRIPGFIMWRVFCVQCDGAPRAELTDQEAIAAWNRRAPDAAIRAAREEMRERAAEVARAEHDKCRARADEAATDHARSVWGASVVTASIVAIAIETLPLDPEPTP